MTDISKLRNKLLKLNNSMSQKDIAKEINLPQQAVSELLHGNYSRIKESRAYIYLKKIEDIEQAGYVDRKSRVRWV